MTDRDLEGGLSDAEFEAELEQLLDEDEQDGDSIAREDTHRASETEFAD